jgi:amino acid permease
VAACIVLIPTVFLRTINEIAPLAAFGMIASSLCVIEVVVFAIIFKPITPGTVSEYNLPVPPSFNTTHHGGAPVSHHILSYTDFPSAFAAITLSFGGHAVFPSIEEHMPRPKQFNKAFNFAYFCLVVMYLATACFGYYAFGSVTYTPILCNFPRDNVSAMGLITATTKLLIAFHVMSAYPILMNVVVREIETGSDLDAEGKTLWRTLLRTILVGSTCLIAIYVPYFGDMMQLVGAMCLTMIVFVLPVIFSWKLWGESMSVVQKTYGLFIIFVGTAGGFVGGIQAILAISKKLQEGATQ